MKSVLTIAGSDCSGGAGIQADIKTITMHNLYATSVLSALTAQNTTGVQAIFDISSDFLEQQLTSVLEDIFPDSVKIGMVSNEASMKIIIKILRKFNVKNIVIDPVMIATSKDKLLQENSYNYLLNEFLYLADILTPNIFEAEIITNKVIKSFDDFKQSAVLISQKYNCDVLVKGGHFNNLGIDILCCKGQLFELKLPYVENLNTHGTGCTLSSALACNIAQGYEIIDACKSAKKYVHGSLLTNFDIGKGNGPLNHMYKIKN